jgi:DNA-binding NarL/FixJ family response regulator
METSIMERARERDFPTHEEPQLLGTIWIDCPYPLLSAGLKRALRARAARLHQGPKPPEGGAPSAVICYADRGDAVTSKVADVMALAPEVPVLVLGQSVNVSLARAGLQAGSKGFIHAQMPPEHVVRALEVAAKGETVLPRELLKALLDEIKSSPEDLPSLTPQKHKILGLVAEGLSNAQIAKRLYISESTVKQHLRAVYKVLGVKNRTEAATVFRRSEQSGGLATLSASAAPSEHYSTGVPSGGGA